MEKLIITVALTGNVHTKENNPNLAVTPEEIAQDVKKCADAGASLFHVLARVFKETGVKPEIEVFETGMINNALHLKKKGWLASPLHFNFVLGAPGSMPGTVKNLSFLSESIPSDSTWTAAGIGKAQIPLATAAIVLGGHARIGLEDSLYMPDGSPASNVKLVEKIVRIAKEIGRGIASPDEARVILSI